MDKKELENSVEKKVSPVLMKMKPRTIQEGMELATILCKSGIVPKEMISRPEAVFMAISYGNELGLSPAQAVTSIMVVNGRPSVWGDAVKALVIGSPVCEMLEEDPPAKALKQGYGRCLCKRVGHKQIEITFSIEDAKKAGLWNKVGPWQNYPGRMLQMRARSWALRDTFPDILKGIQIREEAQDYGEVTTYAPTPMPEEKPVVTPSPVVDAEVVPPSEPGDAQQPGDDPADTISMDVRKELFRVLRETGVSMDKLKIYLFDQHAIKSTSEIPYGLLPEIEKWIKQ